MFQKVTRRENRLRLAIDGPAGAGKTYTALRFAFAIAKREGSKVAVIDTEHNSASLYAGDSPDGVPWDWDGVNLEHFAPSTYTAAIEEAARGKYGVLVIDSLSHAWVGAGGALDQVDRAKQKSGGKFAAWGDVSPQQAKMIDAILRYPGHVIVTMRTKIEYVLEEDEKGRKSVQKVGLRPVQREGVEYEFTIVCDMTEDHVLKVSKTRCSKIDGLVVSKPGPEFISPVLAWLGEAPGEEETPASSETVSRANANDSGASEDGPRKFHARTPASPLQNQDAEEIKRLWTKLGKSRGELLEFLIRKNVGSVAELPAEVSALVRQRLEEEDMKREAEAAF